MLKLSALPTKDPGHAVEQPLNAVLKAIAPARVAAVQVLVRQIESKAEAGHVSGADLMSAAQTLRQVHAVLRDVRSKQLAGQNLTLPDELSRELSDLTAALAELVQITDRYSVNSSGEVKGIETAPDNYALCVQRVLGGLDRFSLGLGDFLLDINARGKADDVSKTSTIALEIGKIGRVINMVATNASIEAARAGDAGKGFTVIADEVKVLSQRVSSLSVSLTERLSAQ